MWLSISNVKIIIYKNLIEKKRLNIQWKVILVTIGGAEL
jgi:hypothetical protein